MKLYGLSEKQLKDIKPADINVSVYGQGKMGLPLAVTFAHKGFNVVGVDVNEKVVSTINKGKNPVVGEEGLDEMLAEVVKNKKLRATIELVEASKKSDIKIIIVPTYIDEYNNPDLSVVQSVTEAIAKGLRKGDIVILESTAPPGTTMTLIGKMLEEKSGLKLNKDFGVAHCPERTSSGTAIADIMGRLNPKIVGGSDEKTTRVIKHIYSIINERGVIAMKDTLSAELVKIWEGVYRDVNIAFANNMYLISREMGVDAKEIIEACNTDHFCHILSPGPGVGGHCIPVYPFFILKNVQKHQELLTLARSINNSMSEHVIQLATNTLQDLGKNIKEASVLVLGIAYRGGVKETRKSPGLKIAGELKKVAKTVFVRDHLFSKQEIENYGFTDKESFDGVDCVIIAANHKEYKDIDWKKVAKTVQTKAIIDTVNIADYDILKKLGFAVHRIGYAE